MDARLFQFIDCSCRNFHIWFACLIRNLARSITNESKSISNASASYNVNKQFIGLRKKLWFHCVQMKQLKQPFFYWQQECFDMKDDLYNQLFIITSTDSCTFPNKDIITKLCLLNKTTNTRWRTQSIVSPTECRTSVQSLNPFCPFHPYLHESVA